MVAPKLDVMVAEQRMKELHRDAELARLAKQARDARRSYEIELGLAPAWQRVPAGAAGRALAAVGRLLLKVGMRLDGFSGARKQPCPDAI